MLPFQWIAVLAVMPGIRRREFLWRDTRLILHGVQAAQAVAGGLHRCVLSRRERRRFNGLLICFHLSELLAHGK